MDLNDGPNLEHQLKPLIEVNQLNYEPVITLEGIK